MTVLIVDDSRVMRMKLKSLIAGTGIPVTTLLEAGHGREGLAFFETHAIDVVLTDINMPEMDGREFLRHLSGRTLARPLYRVVCTTETPQGLRDELKDCGVNLYIEKPFSPEAVKQLLASAAARVAGTPA